MIFMSIRHWIFSSKNIPETSPGQPGLMMLSVWLISYINMISWKYCTIITLHSMRRVGSQHWFPPCSGRQSIQRTITVKGSRQQLAGRAELHSHFHPRFSKKELARVTQGWPASLTAHTSGLTPYTTRDSDNLQCRGRVSGCRVHRASQLESGSSLVHYCTQLNRTENSWLKLQGTGC
jgi:hypothetical protein